MSYVHWCSSFLCVFFPHFLSFWTENICKQAKKFLFSNSLNNKSWIFCFTLILLCCLLRWTRTWLPKLVHYETPATVGLLPVFHPLWDCRVELLCSVTQISSAQLSLMKDDRMTLCRVMCGHVFCVAPFIFNTGFQSAYLFAVHLAFYPDHRGPWKNLKVNFTREDTVIAPRIGAGLTVNGKTDTLFKCITSCRNVQAPSGE